MNDTRADTAVTTNIERNQFESLHVRKTWSMEIIGSLLDNSTSVDFGFEHNTDGLGHSSTC